MRLGVGVEGASVRLGRLGPLRGRCHHHPTQVLLHLRGRLHHGQVSRDGCIDLRLDGARLLRFVVRKGVERRRERSQDVGLGLRALARMRFGETGDLGLMVFCLRRLDTRGMRRGVARAHMVWRLPKGTIARHGLAAR